MLHTAKQASDLKLAGLPLVKDKETSHMLISGTTGSGKTNCLHHLLPQIRQQQAVQLKAAKQKAVVVDLTGDFVDRYYRVGKDLILNPFDDRSCGWSPWAECHHSADYDALAEAFIGTNHNSYDSFWETASKLVLSAALQLPKHANKTSKLVDFITKSNLKQFSNLMKNTKAAVLADYHAEKTALSIRATLVSKIASLEYLPDVSTSFSIKEWVGEDNDQWLFLTASPSQRDALKPLITTWVDCAISGLMNLPTSYDRRVWFIIDELPALQKLPSLTKGLTELRKYGGCIVAGIQDVPQLKTIYGHNCAQTILNQCNTKLFFRSTDPETCQYIARALGEKEESEIKENLSYGANTIRDGVSLNEVSKTENLVLPTEVVQLSDLECYVKLPGNWPITKLQMKYAS